MATLQGISGGMSGRTGSFTYRQSRGQTIVSQYQPIVKNPNSQGQQTQRAKFKLMSQLAAIMSPGFGTMGINERPARQRPTQRNAFMQLNMPLVEVETSVDSVTAKIPMEQIKLTSSYLNLGTLTAEYEGQNLTATVDQVPANVEFVQFVLLRRVANEPPTLMTVQRIQRTSAEQTEISATFNALGTGNFTILAFGLIPADGSVSTKLDNIFSPQTSITEAAVTLNQLVSKGQLSETETLGTVVASS